jgi:peptidoglycan/xylan/chitin deacetylase (PgdA/CDA1 family)
MMARSNIALRSALAWTINKTRSYSPSQWACGRLAGGFILAYHDLPAEVFEAHMLALRPNQPVHLTELFERAKAGRSTAGLFAATFDDGVASTVRDIAAVCKRRSWPVSFYLPTQYLDDRQGMPFQLWIRVAPHLPRTVISLPSRTLDLSSAEAVFRFKEQVMTDMHTRSRSSYEPVILELVRWMLERQPQLRKTLEPPPPITWKEVAELSRHEVLRFESHGVSHTAVAGLSAQCLEAELLASKKRISEHTNRECRHFCYPFGSAQSIGGVAPTIVAKHYDTATTMARGRLRRHPWYLMPRIPVYSRDQPAVVQLKTLTV